MDETMVPRKQTTQRNRFTALAGWSAAIILCSSVHISGSPAAAEEHFTGTTMGPVVYRVTIDRRPGAFSHVRLHSLIDETLEDVNRRMSTYLADSEVSRFNAAQTTDWFEVSAQTAEVVARAQEISRRTEGAFDITVGPLVDLWQFGPEKGAAAVPSDEAIDEALERVGFQRLEVRPDPPALRKTDPRTRIDLSAIAKGYAVDRVAVQLDALGVSAYLVEVGGEVRTRGAKASGEEWVVGIELPIPGIRQVGHRVSLADQSLATSGDYRNFVVIDGQTYSHTIDPRTGRPVRNDLASVSVVATDCMTADALATAIMVAGPDRAETLAGRFDAAALWTRRVDDRLQSDSTADFPLVAGDATAENSTSLGPMFVAAIVVFGIAVLSMSVGALLARKPIKGSCGGLSALGARIGKPMCEVCDAGSEGCDEFREAVRRGSGEQTSASSGPPTASS